MEKSRETISLHLPEEFWALLKRQTEETHPTIDIDEFSIDVPVGKPSTYKIQEPDDTCESKFRYVEVDVQIYYTLTLQAQLVKDLEVKCQHKIDYQWKQSKNKAKVVKRTLGDCVPKTF